MPLHLNGSLVSCADVSLVYWMICIMCQCSLSCLDDHCLRKPWTWLIGSDSFSVKKPDLLEILKMETYCSRRGFGFKKDPPSSESVCGKPYSKQNGEAESDGFRQTRAQASLYHRLSGLLGRGVVTQQVNIISIKDFSFLFSPNRASSFTFLDLGKCHLSSGFFSLL